MLQNFNLSRVILFDGMQNVCFALTHTHPISPTLTRTNTHKHAQARTHTLMQFRISIIKDPGGKVIVGFTLGTKTCALACIVLMPQSFYFLLLKCNLLRAVHEVSW